LEDYKPLMICNLNAYFWWSMHNLFVESAPFLVRHQFLKNLFLDKVGSSWYTIYRREPCWFNLWLLTREQYRWLRYNACHRQGQKKHLPLSGRVLFCRLFSVVPNPTKQTIYFV
jgi:hypothetical protein